MRAALRLCSGQAVTVALAVVGTGVLVACSGTDAASAGAALVDQRQHVVYERVV